MLTRLQVRDFAIVDQIEIEFRSGMTVLTGETGAGKSILVDALGLVLGDRGSSQLVREGANRAEFSAEFRVENMPAVNAWLEDNALDQDDECLLRRVINADGRSRAFVNGNSVTMQQLKTLGDQLLDIHGQQFHQSLAKRDVQRELLDHFGDLQNQRQQTAQAYTEWKALLDRLNALRAADADRASRIDLLTFQLGELDTLNVTEDEIAELQSERQKLLHSGRLAEGLATAIARLTEDESSNATALLAEATRAVSGLLEFDGQLRQVVDLLESASIQIAEATDSLQRYTDSIDMDPGRRDWVEERLDSVQSLARKHRIEPLELPALNARLREEYEELSQAEERGAELERQVGAAHDYFSKLAAELSTARMHAGEAFSAAVTAAMDGLGMAGGTFAVDIQPLPGDAARSWGIDAIEFLISANPGQPPMPLARVASGGELSRMSLAIQVIASDGSAIPTMVFDEVDSGVGGRVAEMVGLRLRELGAMRQVLCVTHLPQVASLADQQYRISKVTDGKATRTRVAVLNRDERIEEVARMLGGEVVTDTARRHAREMLSQNIHS